MSAPGAAAREGGAWAPTNTAATSATTNANGYVEPGRQALYAAMMMQSEIYPKMLNLVRELCGGGLIQLPSNVEDFANPEIRAAYLEGGH